MYYFHSVFFHVRDTEVLSAWVQCNALLNWLSAFCSHRIHRHALWIMGEYANSKQDILNVTEEIKKGLGDVRSPFFLITYICGLSL